LQNLLLIDGRLLSPQSSYIGRGHRGYACGEKDFQCNDTKMKWVADNDSLPGNGERLFGFTYYLGLAPLTRYYRRPSDNSFLSHHYSQAMAALFLLLLCFLAACLYDAAECILYVRFPALAQRLMDEWGNVLAYLDYVFLLAIVVIALLWIALASRSLAGSTRQFSVVRCFAGTAWVLRFSFLANSLILALVPVIAVFALYATSLTRRNTENAAVYFLYDEGIGVPRWAFAMGLYRISLQARHRWGNGTTVLDHLNRKTLGTALANAKVLILATHGDSGCATTWYAPEVLRIAPPEIAAVNERNSVRFLRVSVLAADKKWSVQQNMAVNAHLQTAYIFACDGGAKAAEWAEHLSPARVITYNRTSTVWDHALWFALTGPALLAQKEEKPGR